LFHQGLQLVQPLLVLLVGGAQLGDGGVELVALDVAGAAGQPDDDEGGDEGTQDRHPGSHQGFPPGVWNAGPIWQCCWPGGGTEAADCLPDPTPIGRRVQNRKTLRRNTEGAAAKPEWRGSAPPPAPAGLTTAQRPGGEGAAPGPGVYHARPTHPFISIKGYKQRCPATSSLPSRSPRATRTRWPTRSPMRCWTRS